MPGPKLNSASFVSQWKEVLVARVCIAINEDMGQVNMSVIELKCSELYNRLVPYQSMCREYPDFGREVTEIAWKGGPIKADQTPQNQGKAIWRKWKDGDGILYRARNGWGRLWARHNQNGGPPSGLSHEDHFTAFKKKFYIQSMKDKKVEGKYAECSSILYLLMFYYTIVDEAAVPSDYYPSWWKVFMIFGPGSPSGCNPLLDREMTGVNNDQKASKKKEKEDINPREQLKVEDCDKHGTSRAHQRGLSVEIKSEKSADSQLAKHVMIESDRNELDRYTVDQRRRESKTLELEKRIALYSHLGEEQKANDCRLKLLDHLEYSPPPPPRSR